MKRGLLKVPQPFNNSATCWGPSVKTHEPMEATLTFKPYYQLGPKLQKAVTIEGVLTEFLTHTYEPERASSLSIYPRLHNLQLPPFPINMQLL